MYFNIAGDYMYSVQHVDRAWQAVCCSPDYIFLAGSAVEDGSYSEVVEVCTWANDTIQILSHQELGVDESTHILAIRCKHDETVLQLVTYNIKDDGYSLHAYKVSDNLP